MKNLNLYTEKLNTIDNIVAPYYDKHVKNNNLLTSDMLKLLIIDIEKLIISDF